MKCISVALEQTLVALKHIRIALKTIMIALKPTRNALKTIRIALKPIRIALKLKRIALIVIFYIFAAFNPLFKPYEYIPQKKNEALHRPREIGARCAPTFGSQRHYQSIYLFKKSGRLAHKLCPQPKQRQSLPNKQ